MGRPPMAREGEQAVTRQSKLELLKNGICVVQIVLDEADVQRACGQTFSPDTRNTSRPSPYPGERPRGLRLVRRSALKIP